MTTHPTPAELRQEVPNMLTIHADLSRFNGAGYGTLHHIPSELSARRPFAVTDDEADTLEAEVISVEADTAEVRVHWERVLHRA